MHKCVLYYSHRVTIHLQLTNISYILLSDWYQRLLVKMIRTTDFLKVVRLRMVGAISLLPFSLHCIVLRLVHGLALYYSFLSEDTFFLVGFLSNCD